MPSERIKLTPRCKRTLETIQKNLITLRKLRKLTQKQLADNAFVSLSTIQKLERGDFNVSMERVVLVFLALGVLDKFKDCLDISKTPENMEMIFDGLPQRVRNAKE